MGRLILVRHGQASFGAADYDQLSALGAQQSEALGRWWQDRDFVPDALYEGQCRRHIQTGDALREVMAGLPAAAAAEGFNEYPAFELLKRVQPLLQEDPEFAALIEGLRAGDGRATQKLIQAVTLRWARGDLDVEGVETWVAFRARVEAQVKTLLAAHGQGAKTVVALTSAGPISAAVGMALGLTHARCMELSWNLYNASTTTFLFSRDRFTLSAFNVTSHLPEEMITYR